MTNNKTNTLIAVAFLIFGWMQTGFGQPSEPIISKSQYIEQWKDEAIHQMHKYGIPASITLAQGILESGNGNSELAKYANNHFGIKCHGWDGPGLYKDDDKPNECFRKYNNAKESFEDHSLFLKNKSRYAELFELKTTNYKGWAKGLKKAGYATNPKYPELLIQIIEENNLSRFDLEEENLLEIAPPVVANTNSASTNKHTVMLHQNKIRYIIVKEGDTFYKIAKEFEIGLWQLYKYNDFYENDFIQPGDIIFIQPKRKRTKNKFYTVKKGETIQSISQEQGIRLKSILKRNNLTPEDELTPGMQLRMR